MAAAAAGTGSSSGRQAAVAMQRRRRQQQQLPAAPATRSSSGAAAVAAGLLLPLLLLALSFPTAQGVTTPDNFDRLVAFRDAMRTRSPNWAAALELWKCPTPPANSVPAGSCDPCGMQSDGNWYHMHCRGNSRGWGESGDGTHNGITTNVHITSSRVDGPVPKELCIIPTLREHDFGGQLWKGHLTGPLPRFLGACYQALEELDLSNNRLTGTIPPYLATLPLSEIKVENNALIGTIPPELGSIKRLRRFQVEFNNMNGRIPDSFRNANPYLTQLHLARNDFEGDLSMLAGGHLTTVTLHDNRRLCGMVPASVRYAKGYNPGGTGLGRPCPGAPPLGAADAAAGAAPSPAPAPADATASPASPDARAPSPSPNPSSSSRAGGRASSDPSPDAAPTAFAASSPAAANGP